MLVLESDKESYEPLGVHLKETVNEDMTVIGPSPGDIFGRNL